MGRRTILQDFISTSLQCIFVSVEKDKVRVMEQIQGKAGKKVLFMAKSSAEKLNPGVPFEDQWLYGELSSAYLNQLLVITKDVFFPILENVENRAQWQQPDVIGKQVISNYHKFLASLTVLQGLVAGKTILPLPPDGPSPDFGQDKTAMQAQDKDRLHALEDAVVSWMHQIKVVMEDDPEKLLHESQHPGAGKQVDFWRAKAESLNNINDQLESPKVTSQQQITHRSV